MKKILCYGDSNTWGCSPRDSSRYDENTRWPMVMQSILAGNYTVTEEGLNGRTVLNLAPENSEANGIEWISVVIEKHIPVDIVLISLGLNDVFIAEEASLNEISDGVEEIINIIRNSHVSAGFQVPQIIIMAPPEYNADVEGSDFFELQINKLKILPESLRSLSIKQNCLFFNSADYVKGSSIDGSHLEAESHIILGNEIAEFISGRIK
jgi:lysophospholipase L1-like esterase